MYLNSGIINNSKYLRGDVEAYDKSRSNKHFNKLHESYSGF
jgi:hypothetical protein